MSASRGVPFDESVHEALTPRRVEGAAFTDPIQRRVLAWIMKHRRDLVNYTDFPAVNWFTFPAMSDAFRRHGLEPLDRIDLLARRNSGGLKGALVGAMHRMPVLKWPYYFYAISMGLYGVKRAR